MNRLALVVGLVAASLVPAPEADACATAPPRGAEVQIAEEEALIVWDPATKTEQFVRRARFSSTAKSFGFLVPTPTAPKLDEAPDYVFNMLGDAIRPAWETDTSGYDVQLGSLLFEACVLPMRKSADGMDDARSSVRVISVAHVAGFDATTLEADDAGALASWLAVRGFESTPALTQWLDRYVKEKWMVTAFVVASDQSDTTRFEVGTRAVRMTFQTDRPFYPYREPTEDPKAGQAAPRILRVFFVSDQRYQAMVAQSPWHARVLYSAAIAAHGDLAAALGSHRMATVFVDDVSPRKGIDELYFYPSTSTVDVRQPPIVTHDPTTFFIPVDLIVIVGLIGYGIVRRRRRR